MHFRERLKHIQERLKVTKKSDPQSAILYQEAADIFLKLGNRKSAELCLQYTKRSNNLAKLPVELLVKVTKNLDMFAVLQLCQVSKELRQKLHSDHQFWINFDLGSHAKNLTNKDFTRIWKLNRGNCKRMTLLTPRKLTLTFVKDLSSYLPRCLEFLKIQDTLKLPSAPLLSFLAKPTLANTLKSIDLSFFRSLDDRTVNRIVLYLPRLEYLNVTGCAQLTNGVFGVSNDPKFAVIFYLSGNMYQYSYSTPLQHR